MNEVSSRSHAVLSITIEYRDRAAGNDADVAIGKLSMNAAKSFGQGAFHFSSHDELGRALIKILDKNSNILIKGSRAMKMECLIEMLMEKK